MDVRELEKIHRDKGICVSATFGKYATDVSATRVEVDKGLSITIESGPLGV